MNVQIFRNHDAHKPHEQRSWSKIALLACATGLGITALVSLATCNMGPVPPFTGDQELDSNLDNDVASKKSVATDSPTSEPTPHYASIGAVNHGKLTPEQEQVQVPTETPTPTPVAPEPEIVVVQQQVVQEEHKQLTVEHESENAVPQAAVPQPTPTTEKPREVHTPVFRSPVPTQVATPTVPPTEQATHAVQPTATKTPSNRLPPQGAVPRPPTATPGAAPSEFEQMIVRIKKGTFNINSLDSCKATDRGKLSREFLAILPPRCARGMIEYILRPQSACVIRRAGKRPTVEFNEDRFRYGQACVPASKQ